MKLYILNDNINSFEHVIQTIQRYLNYPYLQATSIAYIIHHSGQCEVKESDDEELIDELYRMLVKQGLNLKIES